MHFYMPVISQNNSNLSYKHNFQHEMEVSPNLVDQSPGV